MNGIGNGDNRDDGENQAGMMAMTIVRLMARALQTYICAHIHAYTCVSAGRLATTHNTRILQMHNYTGVSACIHRHIARVHRGVVGSGEGVPSVVRDPRDHLHARGVGMLLPVESVR